MDFRLKNEAFDADGVFGALYDAANKAIAVTLQHAYDSGKGDGSYLPKIPPGVYKCVRGQHRLEGMSADFTTFEITGVDGHTNLLFHWGNYNLDSEGCVLLGEHVAPTDNGLMITNSRDTFAKFMGLLTGVDSFTLTVE